VTHSRPPCSSARRRLTRSPMPEPDATCRAASVRCPLKITSWSPVAIPIPLSRTTTCANLDTAVRGGDAVARVVTACNAGRNPVASACLQEVHI
jgi:hypothetical protein